MSNQDSMTSPDPEYPIRALVKADAITYIGVGLCVLINVRQGTLNRADSGDVDFSSTDRYYSDGAVVGIELPLTWYPKELILDPTPEDIASEQAKLKAGTA